MTSWFSKQKKPLKCTILHVQFYTALSCCILHTRVLLQQFIISYQSSHCLENTDWRKEIPVKLEAAPHWVLLELSPVTIIIFILCVTCYDLAFLSLTVSKVINPITNACSFWLAKKLTSKYFIQVLTGTYVCKVHQP